MKDPDAAGKPAANPMSDPAGMDQMMNMLKGNMAMIVPQTLIMGWINAFFSGFVISRLLRREGERAGGWVGADCCVFLQ